ncbi:hypothetical protein CYY_007501 [Polysphondylium violaceum]|uniref:Uncharacterized protein n=1 Tax=Polysphondylium violaceum TaxID=133409 RepID=A0A8J4PPK7_9MYCE|nr:hypothetical protein CYY_007501 [Polysphondylium violaceum]
MKSFKVYIFQISGKLGHVGAILEYPTNIFIDGDVDGDQCIFTKFDFGYSSPIAKIFWQAKDNEGENGSEYNYLQYTVLQYQCIDDILNEGDKILYKFEYDVKGDSNYEAILNIMLDASNYILSENNCKVYVIHLLDRLNEYRGGQVNSGKECLARDQLRQIIDKAT